MREIIIVVAVNRNYIKPMSVMLTSVLRNNLEYKIVFNIFQDDFSEEDKEGVNNKFKKYSNLTLRYITITNEIFEGLPTLEHISLSTYYRILAPKLLPEYDKIMYLDSDLVVDGNILEFWDINIDRYVVAAVREESIQSNEERLGIPMNQKYFNAGVLLINSKKIRDENYFDVIMDYMIKNKEILLFSDQDALNAIFYNKWLEIDEKWNYHNYFVDMKKSKLELIKKDNPVIIHYTGPIKPWNEENGSVLTNIYLKYEDIYLLENDIKTTSTKVKINKGFTNYLELKSKIFLRFRKIKLMILLNKFLKSNTYTKKLYYKIKSNIEPSQKIIKAFEAREIDFKDALYESNLDFYISKFREYEKYIEIEGYVFKRIFLTREVIKILVIYSKDMSKKYFFKLGTVDREICNSIYLDGNDYSSAGFHNFISKERLENGEYELGLLLTKQGQTHFKKINKTIIV